MVSTTHTLDIGLGATATVKVLHTTEIENLRIDNFMCPPVPGRHTLPSTPSFSFLIESQSGEKVLFDLGVRKDFQDVMNNAVKVALDKHGYVIKVKQNVSDVLQESGMNLEEISAVIWSHWHWDHTGDMLQFPSSTKLVVGPGFIESFVVNNDKQEDTLMGIVLESQYRGREVSEVKFDGPHTRRIGDFRAWDFWGDGSLYLLDTPGHAIGHLCALIRTTDDPTSFVFLGGDIAHHGGIFRPSQQLSIPASICPGHLFEAMQSSRQRRLDEPIFDPAIGHDVAEAKDTIRKMQSLDALDNVWVIIAHDSSIQHVLQYFPESINDWQREDRASETKWTFWQDLLPMTETPK